MYSNTLILDYFHYISAKTDIIKKEKHFLKMSSFLTLLVTLDMWLVYLAGTVRGGSQKIMKGFCQTLHK